MRWPDQIPHMAALYSAVNPDDVTTAGEVEGIFGSRVDMAHFLAFDGPDAVGFGSISRRGSRPLPGCRVTVLPTHRRRGMGSALFAELAGHAAALGYDEVLTFVREVHPEGLEFALHRGFVELSRALDLELDLTVCEPPPSSRLPASTSSPGPSGRT